MEYIDCRNYVLKVFLAVLITQFLVTGQLSAVELPLELPLWEKVPQDYAVRNDAREQLRSYKAQDESPSGSNRVFSQVSLPTYAIHRPKNPNGVGIVICPGGGFRDIWIDREGHDLAIWLKSYGITSLVLKYRTRVPSNNDSTNTRPKYIREVQADGRQAIRIMRRQAKELGLRPDGIGICGFSAGGHLALTTAIRPEGKVPNGKVSGMPDFAGLFYPGIPDDVEQIMETRAAATNMPDICPLFIINARVDELTPVDKCFDFYGMLLKIGVQAELHIYSKGSHGFDLGTGRGKSIEIWPSSFIAWLSDSGIIQQKD